MKQVLHGFAFWCFTENYWRYSLSLGRWCGLSSPHNLFGQLQFATSGQQKLLHANKYTYITYILKQIHKLHITALNLSTHLPIFRRSYWLVAVVPLKANLGKRGLSSKGTVRTWYKAPQQITWTSLLWLRQHQTPLARGHFRGPHFYKNFQRPSLLQKLSEPTPPVEVASNTFI